MALAQFAQDAKDLVGEAQNLADERKHALVEPIHLLVRGVDSDRGIAEVFRRASAEPAEVLKEGEAQLARLGKGTAGLAYLSSGMLSLLDRARKEAGTRPVTVEQLLNALAQEIRGPAAAVLQAFALGPGSFRPHMAALKEAKDAPRPAEGAAAAAPRKFTRDLIAASREAKDGPVIGRDVEVRRLLQILERRQKNHPLLVGEPGVGKTAIVGELAARIAAGDVPENLSKLALLELEVGALTAGAKLRGEVEERLRQTLRDIQSSGPREALLYIRGLDALFGQGASGSGVGDLLKPMLARGDMRLLASTTPDGARKIEEKDAAFFRSFSVLTIEPSTPDQAVEILRGVAPRYEALHHVQIGDPAIGNAVRLARRYIPDRALPDSALDLLDEAAARKRVELDGVPAEYDVAIRRLASLRAQRASLIDDVDAMSKKTRDRIEREIATLDPNVTRMLAQLQSRRGAVAAQSALRAERAKLEASLVEAREKQDLARMGEIEHVTLPDVVRRLDLATAAVVKEGGAAGANVVTEEDVALVLGEWTGIPVAKMLETETEKLLKMEERLSARVIGQDEAVRAMSRAVRRGRVGLRDPGKPIGSFLFLGPSGVGKTELAKVLAEFLFDDEQAMTRLDMSEFMEKHMAQRLVGAPPGYADSEEGGFLTEAVRKKPYSVLLFDEVEKAHADVFNLLLQVLDDGRLTDGRGRLADFSNTVVVMTSNIGGGRILEADPKLFSTPDGREALRDILQEELRSFLRPEFLNRIDDVILFRPLSRDDLRGIVDIQLRRLDKLVEGRELKVALTEAAKGRLVELGYEPAYGARPLKRAILKNVQDPLAEEILAGRFPPGSVVHVDVANELFVFSRKD